MKAYSINTKAGVSICTPPDIHLMTPYILLEQEQWFEPEVQFIQDFLQPGMKALDIGACFGVYALPMAKAVGPEGEVFAFEPCAQVREYLDESARQNNLENVQIIPLALADRSGQVKLKTAKTPELNAMSLSGDSGAAEHVEAIMLDAWWAENGCPRIDVVKVDVNGYEARVIQGGHAFFTQTSPVVVVSIKDNDQLNHQTIKALMDHGYGLYQYLPELEALAPFDHQAKPDAYLLNLLAVKSDVTSKLQEKGIIAQGAFEAPGPQAGYWEKCLSAMPWTASFLPTWQQNVQNNAFRDYLEALDFVCATQELDAIGTTKFAQAFQATQRLMMIYKKSQGASAGPVALTLSRALNMLGLREEAVQVLEILVESIKNGKEKDFSLPFLSPLPRFDQMPVQDSVEEWIAAKCNESLIFLRSLSGYFNSSLDRQLLQLLHENPERCLESQRRLAMIMMRQGQKVQIRPDSR
ncbi:MAG: FkbM family methyltransferase, partial [Desulfatiglandaceae bacterium]